MSRAGVGLVLALAACAPSAVTSPPGPAPAQRLTPGEYNRTILDLFGFPADVYRWPALPGETEWGDVDEEFFTAPWPWTFPEEVTVDGFDGMVDGQVASAWLVERYEAAATHYAAFALVSPLFFACDGWDGLDTPDRVVCAWPSVERFAARAWRRPLTVEETGRLRTLHDANVEAYGPDAGAVATVEALLQTPRFLFRLEDGAGGRGSSALTDWEVASKLSYFLWDSMPDATLFAAAAAGELATAAQVRAQAERMMADPRAHEAVLQFHRQWLDTDAVFQSRADLDTYATTYASRFIEASADEQQDLEEAWSMALVGMRRSMSLEADLFVERTVFEGGGDLAALLTDHHGYVSRDTRAVYGVTDADILPGPTYAYAFDDMNLAYDIHLQPAEFPAAQRSGVLTLPAVLAGRAHPVHPAPVLRGTFVMERLMCEAVGQPPDSAEGAAPPDTPDAADSNRVRMETITGGAPCNACHDRFNPLGFAFENYDSLGGWREVDNGQTVDASGTVSIGQEGASSFSNAVELGQVLAASPAVHDCYARHWVRYGLGHMEDDADAVILAPLQQSFRDSGGDVRQLLVDIAASDLFRFHTGDAP